VPKLNHRGEKTLKTNPNPPGWGMDIGLATQFLKNKFCSEISVKYSRLDNFASKNVENFNYLGFTLNADNKMNIEIAERIAKGNKAYYANAKLIK